MNYLHTLIQWFQHLPINSKKGFLAISSLMLIGTAFLIWWVLSPSYAILFNHLDEQDANKVLSQLEQEHIAYQLDHGGSDILIDKPLIAKTRLKIMGSGLQFSGNVGFELFDKNDFGMTDFSQKINYQRALQGELERTISSLDEVQQARVHLVIPESHLFDKETSQPTAAVTLHLKQGITPKQVHSIQQLVAASVAHLNLKRVLVVDQNGNTLSQEEEQDSASHFTSKKNIEHYLNNKVTQILHTIFAQNQVMVKINAEINYDELQRELIKPQDQGQVTHEKEIKHSTASKKGKNKLNQELTREKTYEFGSEKELFKRASGTIERLSISVALPQNTDEQTLAQVQRLVKSAVGFNEQRGDVISVEALIRIEPEITYHSLSALPPIPLINNAKEHQPLKDFIPVFLIASLALSSTTVLLLKRSRRKKRQLLLLELSQWLNQHE